MLLVWSTVLFREALEKVSAICRHFRFQGHVVSHNQISLALGKIVAHEEANYPNGCDIELEPMVYGQFQG